jgi:hypothetical protein
MLEKLRLFNGPFQQLHATRAATQGQVYPLNPQLIPQMLKGADHIADAEDGKIMIPGFFRFRVNG